MDYVAYPQNKPVADDYYTVVRRLVGDQERMTCRWDSSVSKWYLVDQASAIDAEGGDYDIVAFFPQPDIPEYVILKA